MFFMIFLVPKISSIFFPGGGGGCPKNVRYFGDAEIYLENINTVLFLVGKIQMYTPKLQHPVNGLM